MTEHEWMECTDPKQLREASRAKSVPAEALVEAVFQVKDGKRSIALMNWAFRHEVEKVGP